VNKYVSGWDLRNQKIKLNGASVGLDNIIEQLTAVKASLEDQAMSASRLVREADTLNAELYALRKALRALVYEGVNGDWVKVWQEHPIISTVTDGN
jgi:hypothetical protein